MVLLFLCGLGLVGLRFLASYVGAFNFKLGLLGYASMSEYQKIYCFYYHLSVHSSLIRRTLLYSAKLGTCADTDLTQLLGVLRPQH